MVHQVKNTRGCLVDEITVMGHIKYGSGVLIQCIFQNFFRSDVQVVRRLVQNQEVRLGEHQLCKRYSSAFSAAQITDHLKYIIACE